MQIAAFVFGILAVLTFLLSYQCRSRKNIILLNIISRMLYVAQYLCLGAYDGIALDSCAAVSSALAARKDHPRIARRRRLVFLLANALLCAAGLLFYRNVFSLVGLVAAIVETCALWLDRESSIRWLTLVSAPIWFAYNFANGAVGSMVGNVLTVVSVGIALYRHRSRA